jgi:hypothetical protein
VAIALKQKRTLLVVDRRPVSASGQFPCSGHERDVGPSRPAFLFHQGDTLTPEGGIGYCH